MENSLWLGYWFEHFLTHATLVTESNPLLLGWCVYIEVFELD